jgi:hypothetical protein
MKRFSRSSVWLLDLALVLFGLLVLFLVTRILRFDDPSLLSNAWTYFLLVPTVLIGSAMLARVLLSEQAERSIQAGFLLSVLVHLGLTYVALHTVLFAGSGSQGEQRAVAQANKKRLLEASRAASFVSSVERMQVDGKVSQAKPDYLRPVEVEQTLEDSIDFQSQTQAPRALERLDRDRFELPLEPTLQAGVELGDTQRANDGISEPELVVTEMERIGRPESQERLEQAQGQRKIEYESALVDAGVQEDVMVGRTPSLERLAPSSSSASALAEGFSQIAIPGMTEVGSSVRGAMRVGRGGVGPSEQVPLPTLDDGLRGLERPELKGVLERRIDSMGRASRVPIPTQNLQGEQRLEEVQGEQGGMEGGGSVAGATNGVEASTDLATMLADRVQTRVSREAAGGLAGGVASSLDFGAIDPLAMSMATGVSGSSGGRGKGKGDVDSIEGRERVGIEVGGNSATIGGIASEAESLSQFRRPIGRVASGVMGMKELVPIPAPAFEQRMRRIDDLGSGGETRVEFGDELRAMGPLGPQTELAIERGLEFLAKYQRSDGSWHLEDYGRGTLMRSDTAATALALLAFQGAGYSHVQAKHRDVCGRALTYLLGGQRPNGDLYRPMDEASDRNSWLYSHAIGSLALCEAYGMTRDETLRSGAQRAIDFLVASQDVKEGGWRYAPRVGSDTSVTGWAMMALKSAELSGLSVPEPTYDRISGWLDRSQGSGEGQGYLYRYNYLANTPETEHGRVPTPVMTSVGLLMRLYLGWDREHPMMLQGAQWLSARRPTLGTKQVPQRDTYYWYYATQVMFHVGGESWRGWYEALYPMLIETQVSEGIYAGSWEPDGPIPDAWGAYAGRLYVTTMNLLSLEVTYRHLPIYEAVVR